MPLIGLFREYSGIEPHFQTKIVNAKKYIQLLKNDIYFFSKLKESKKLKLQYFVNVYFWTFKWINEPQHKFIDKILETDSTLVEKYSENLNAFYYDLYNKKQDIQVSSLEIDENQYFTDRPSFISFNWVTILAISYYSGGVATSILTNWKLYKKPILDFMTKNVWQSVLWEPIIKIFKTLNDYDSKDLSMVASDYTLMNEKDSLKEQYQTFLAKNNTQKISEEQNYDDDQLEKNFLHLYNKIINKPWASFVKGDLITVLMITLQRVKLEANVSLSSIDKMIQSQNLLIKLIGITPAIMILYSTYKFIIKPIIYDAPLSIFTNLINFVRSQVYILTNSSKNVYKEYKILYCKLLNSSKSAAEGNYFVALEELLELGLQHIPKELEIYWIQQIQKILYSEVSKESMVHLIALDSAYAVYFK
ncbi:hypothetical protein QEN19_000146 [Hanseniaspora menglaensis]